jgi:hypothetical protein
MTTNLRSDAQSVKRFSWDGVSFQVPAGWDLSHYHFGPGSCTVQMEDDESLRLEIEWTRSRREMDAAATGRRCDAAARELAAGAAEAREVDGLPAGWEAGVYRLAEAKTLAAAFRLAPDRRFFCSLRLHFAGAAGEAPARTLRLIASSMQTRERGLVPWDVYDASFRLDRSFRLVATSFEAGRKLFVFQWRLRKLHVWFFSLADILLRRQGAAEWAAGFLGKVPDLRGPRFTSQDERVLAGRRGLFPLTRCEELGRLCFRYRVGWARLEDRNALLLTVFNYRRSADLAVLDRSFLVGAGPEAPPAGVRKALSL